MQLRYHKRKHKHKRRRKRKHNTTQHSDAASQSALLSRRRRSQSHSNQPKGFAQELDCTYSERRSAQPLIHFESHSSRRRRQRRRARPLAALGALSRLSCHLAARARQTFCRNRTLCPTETSSSSLYEQHLRTPSYRALSRARLTRSSEARKRASCFAVSCPLGGGRLAHFRSAVAPAERMAPFRRRRLLLR